MTPAATVITPWLHGSRAVELANRTWKKRILPVGDVEYQGRTLHFSRDYLSTLVNAFRSGAYDQVSFQLADAKNSHTNDPERHRGTVTGLELEPDGLYALAQVTEAGERVLTENPMLGVSARIVENYARSDGKYFPAAIQHVLGTLDPRIPALGPWQSVDMSNDAGPVYIDLSGSSWLGEPGPSYSGDELTPAEQAELDQVLAEVQAEAAAAYQEEQGMLADEFNAAFTANWAAEQAREQARQYADLEDLTRPARTDEDIMARAISRAQDGIYDTSRVSSFSNEEAAIELTVQTGEGLCGSPDPFGRCSSRFHDLRCVHAVSTDWQASEPPRSTYEAALSNFAGSHATGTSPAGYGDYGDPDSTGHPIPAGTLELAHALNESWGMLGDTWEGPNRPRQDAYSAMAAEAGYPDPAPQPQLPGGYRDIRELARGMGLK
jgi:hypothetical protein